MRPLTGYDSSSAGSIIQVLDLDGSAAVGSIGIGRGVQGDDMGTVWVDLAASSCVAVLQHHTKSARRRGGNPLGTDLSVPGGDTGEGLAVAATAAGG